MLLLKLCFDRRKEDRLCASVVSSYAGACLAISRGHREPGRGVHSLEGSLLVEYGGKWFQVMGSCLTMKAWPQVEEPRLDRTSGKGDSKERCVGNYAKDGVADGLVLRNQEESTVNGQGAGRVNNHSSCSSPTVPFDFTMIYLLYHPPCYLKHSTSISHAICELEMVIINYHKCSKKVLC